MYVNTLEAVVFDIHQIESLEDTRNVHAGGGISFEKYVHGTNFLSITCVYAKPLSEAL